MMSNGYTLRLTSEALDNDSGNIAFVNLKNIDDYNDLKNDINKKFNGVVVERVYEVLQDISAQVIDTIVPISLITLIGTLIFALINIINVILINNLDNRANYGIMKSLGFTSAYIKRRSNFRILILTSLAAIIGFIANILTTKKLLELCIGFDVLNFNINMTIVFIFIVFILITLVMKICNRAIDKISIIDLIKE